MILLYDKTYNGFLSAVFYAYENSIEDRCVIEKNTGLCPLCDYILIETDEGRASRVERKLEVFNSGNVIYKAWLTGEENMDSEIFEYIRRVLVKKRGIVGEKAVPCVKAVTDAAARVGTEIHRYHQFVRFMKVHEKPDVYVADIEPIYDILPFLGYHFTRRFPSQCFIIRDMRFKKSLVWDTESWYISEEPAILAAAVKDNSEFGQMWKGYFEAVAIPWRRNKKLQAQFVPSRFRRYLTEF